MSALNNPERLKQLAEEAKWERHETRRLARNSERSGDQIAKGFDYKLAQAGERQPGED